MKKCIECGQSFVDTDQIKCPFCNSEDLIDLPADVTNTHRHYVDNSFEDNYGSE